MGRQGGGSPMGKRGVQGSPLGRRGEQENSSIRRAPKTPPARVISAFARSSNRDTRSDVFHTGPLDLVTDRVKNVYLGFSIILMFPVVLLNILIVLRLNSVPNYWEDDIAAQISIMRVPSDFVLGERSELPMRVLVANAAKLPVNDIVVRTAVESVVPDADFAFCAQKFIAGSFLHRRLNEVCSPLLDGFEARTDNAGFAEFTELAVIAGVPGNYVLNVTAYTQSEERDSVGRPITVDFPLVSELVYARVSKNGDVQITHGRDAPDEIEYGKVFDGRGVVCVAGENGGESVCSNGASRPDLSPPSASFRYTGNGRLSPKTTMTFFLVAGFEEMLVNATSISFPRTRVPHQVGSHVRMADYVHGSDASTSYLVSIAETGSVEYPGFVVRGANNPALFFAFYSCGVFQLWNKHTLLPNGVLEVQELAMLPPLDLNGLRAAQGEVWRGGQAFAEVGDDGVAAGDQSYLNELLLTDYPTEVLEGQEFELWMEIYTFRYPRGQRRPVYMPNVVSFAEAIPINGSRDATDEASFTRDHKVLLNAVSRVSTEGVAVFRNLAFSVEGDVGWYRIRVYAEGFFYVESFDIKVFSSVYQVRLKLPAHLQMTYPGCDLNIFPNVDLNGDGNPDYNYSSDARQQQMCIPMVPFQTLVDNLPYVEAFDCDPERFLSTDQNCVPMNDQVLKISAVAWGTTYNRRANGTIRWTHTDSAPNELDGVLSYEWKPSSVDGRYDVTSLAFNNAFHDKYYLTFSVGGIISTSVIAVQLDQTARVEQAVKFCGYSPIAYIDVLDKENIPTLAYPSMSLKLRAFAADALGEPAVGRVLCLRIFELDWHDTFAARVLRLELESRLVRERERNPYTTVENMTYYNKTCFLTGRNGVGELDFYFDSNEMQFREGAFGWYVYSAEFDGGRYYLRQGSRYFLDHEWTAETDARACLASSGYSVPTARTPAYYVHLRPHWTAAAPYALLPTSRHPRVPPEIADSRYPQRSTWYGTLKTRWVVAGTREIIRVRLYEGTALTDELVYPVNVELKTYLLSGPEGFPNRRCAAGDLDDVCYTSAELAFTSAPRTDIDGYAAFAFQATTPGKYRFLLTVGTSVSGGNYFSPVFEIENVPFSAANDCAEAKGLLAASGTVLAPQMKYFHTCPAREEDGGCTWTSTVCDDAAKENLKLLSDVVTPMSTPMCVPIGRPFPSPLAFEVVSDLGEPLSGFRIAIQGAPGSESVVVDPVITPATKVGGNVTDVGVSLHYAAPGEHRLSYSIDRLSSSFTGTSILSAAFEVIDELRASFLPWSPQYALHGKSFSEPVQVNLILIRRCLFNVSDGQARWIPPLVEIVMEPFDAVNGSVQRRATSTVVLEGNIAQPTQTRPGQARAVFPNLKVVEGLQGTYVLKLRVKGSSILLASSIPVQLVTNAANLLLVDEPPTSFDLTSTLHLRVRTTAANGVGISKVYVHALLQPLNQSNDDAAGLISEDPRNMTGTFVLGSDVALSDDEGIAHFALNIERAAPGEYVFGFASTNAPTVWTRAVMLIPNIQSIEIIAAPTISNIYSERTVIWPFLKAKAFDVNFTSKARHGPIYEDPFSMKGIVVGPDENDVILRVKDWRGIAVWGLEFDVRLVDADDDILDKVQSSSRGVTLTQDQGLRQIGPSCSSMEVIFDCHGLYAFPNLATANDVKTGFYRFRFEVGGLAVIHPIDLLFRNYYLPNILYIDLYMIISLASPIMCMVLFQINRADKYIYNPHTAKYSQSAARRLFQSTLPTAMVGFFGVANYYFYLDSDQSKTPPYDADGELIMSDVVAKWLVMFLFAFVFGWLFRSLFGELKRGPNKILEMEHFVNKLGHSESIEVLRRGFVGKVPRSIPKPPKPIPVTTITNKHLKRIDKVIKFISKSITGFVKLLGFLWYAFRVLIKKIQKLYLHLKYQLPMFTSLYQGWPDVHFGQRILTTIMLCFFVVSAALTIGVWFGDRVQGLLSSYYARYLDILSRHGTDQVDWAGEVRASGAGLNSLEEVIVIFCSRTAGRGQEFFDALLNALLSCSIAATVLSTILFALSILKTMAHTREQLCHMRHSKFSVDIKRLTIADACAFIGTQSVLVGFGWGVMYFTCFSLFFIMSWGPTRAVFIRTPLLLLILSGVMYGLSFAVARIRIRRNPGMVIVNRATFAFGEFVWWLIHISVGPFVIAIRLAAAIFGQVGTWFWLWINAHEDIKGVGTLGNSMYSSAVYVHHQHNNPIVRALVERIHVELRNKDTMRLFPNTNTEPATVIREKKALQSKREKRRTVAKLLVMLQMRANDQWELAAQRKHVRAKAAEAAAEEEVEEMEGAIDQVQRGPKAVSIREEALVGDEDEDEDEMDNVFFEEEEGGAAYEMENLETVEIEHPEMDEGQAEGTAEELEEPGQERITTGTKKLMAPPAMAEEEDVEEGKDKKRIQGGG